MCIRQKAILNVNDRIAPIFRVKCQRTAHRFISRVYYRRQPNSGWISMIISHIAKWIQLHNFCGCFEHLDTWVVLRLGSHGHCPAPLSLSRSFKGWSCGVKCFSCNPPQICQPIRIPWIASKPLGGSYGNRSSSPSQRLLSWLTGRQPSTALLLLPLPNLPLIKGHPGFMGPPTIPHFCPKGCPT